MKTIMFTAALALSVGCTVQSVNEPVDVDSGSDAVCKMATPAPMAFACTEDSACAGHRCNVGVGRCAWPCASDCDCKPGNHCEAPACVPDDVGA